MTSSSVLGKSLALFVVAILAATTNAPSSASRNTLVPDDYEHYVAGPIPERIVLVPTATPHNSQTVNWRTDDSVTEAVAEIAPATPHPGLHLEARAITGETHTLESETGKANHHRLTFQDLEPDTVYAYRVKGGDTWSEWLQFRTPAAQFAPYDILYFGDAQNSVKSHFSRVIRQAHRLAPDAALMIHTGDLVSGRDSVHDEEWGEWFDAGGWLYGMTNQLLATGNHEYLKEGEEDEEARFLMPHWALQFGLPRNGPEGLQDSVYFVDFQGVRYIVLDSEAALQNETNARVQTQWLEEVLKNNTASWTIVVHHHPIFSVSLGRDNPLLQTLWQPLYEKYGVHLVLQGHDHTYGRGRNPQDKRHGPVYIVSVAGPKMYRVSPTADNNMDRTGEDRQLFQLIRFEQNRLSYRSITANGELYDAFELVRNGDGFALEDRRPTSDNARCGNPEPPRPNRCWRGTELIDATAPSQ